MRSQSGFTLTEVLAAATALAMLAALAVPRQALMASDSRKQAVRMLALNVETSLSTTHRVWRATGRPERLELDGRQVEMRFGYPTESAVGAVVLAGGAFRFADGYWKHRESRPGQACAVLYIPPPNPDAEPVVFGYTEGC